LVCQSLNDALISKGLRRLVVDLNRHSPFE